MGDQVVHVVLSPVAVDRADDFERFLSETVDAADRAQRPTSRAVGGVSGPRSRSPATPVS
jgi:hypothetical protein